MRALRLPSGVSTRGLDVMPQLWEEAVRLRFVFAWYDLWVGAYWDHEKKTLYVFPVPMFGVRIEFGTQVQESPLYQPPVESTIYRGLTLHGRCPFPPDIIPTDKTECGGMTTLQLQAEGTVTNWWAYECTVCGRRGSRVVAPYHWRPQEYVPVRVQVNREPDKFVTLRDGRTLAHYSADSRTPFKWEGK